MNGLDVLCKTFLETLSSHGFQDNTLSVAPQPHWPSTSHFFPESSSCFQHLHMERSGTQSSCRPGISSLLASHSLGSITRSHGQNVIYTLTTLKYTSLADFSPEFQSHSTCYLVDRSTWVFNRHLKLNLSNTCPFHTHPHLTKRHLCSCTCSGQSCWRRPSLLPFLSFHLLHQQILQLYLTVTSSASSHHHHSATLLKASNRPAWHISGLSKGSLLLPLPVPYLHSTWSDPSILLSSSHSKPPRVRFVIFQIFIESVTLSFFFF